jgi:peptidoglycan hydrolase-like protein with peptidoglycan-binding domain
MHAYLTQEEARRNLSDSEITIFNSLFDDYSARCSAYKYRERAYKSVMAELPARRVELRNDGRDLLDSLLSHGRTRSVTGPLVSQGNHLLDPSQSADVRILQRQMKMREVYSGKIDGIFGSQSRAALMEYQSVIGLTATGNLDRQTQMLLFSGSGI